MTMLNRTFYLRATPGSGLTPYPKDINLAGGGGNKHTTSCYLPVLRKMFFGGGDYSNPWGNNSDVKMTWTYDTLNDVWAQDGYLCGPTGSFMPAGMDECPWAWDPSRNRIWMSYGESSEAEGGTCSAQANVGDPTGAIIKTGTFQYDPVTKVWQLLAPSTDYISAVEHWDYDPVHDQLVAVTNDRVQQYALTNISTTNPNNKINFLSGRGPGEVFDGSNGWIDPTGCRGMQGAVDVLGRKLYMLIPTGFYQNGSLSNTYARLWSLDLDNSTMTKLIDPPQLPVVSSELRIAWDSRNRSIIWGRVLGPEGYIQEVHVYDTTLATPAWQTFGLTVASPNQSVPVRGAAVHYDPKENVCIFAGVAFDSTRAFDGIFLWRYK